MSAAPTDLSPVALASVLLATFVGPQVLPLASAYLVIGAGAFIGALVGLYRRSPLRPMSSLLFVTVMMSVSVGGTVPLATMIASYFDKPQPWFFFPVAVGIAAIGEGWQQVLTWLSEKGMAMLKQLVPGGTKNDP